MSSIDLVVTEKIMYKYTDGRSIRATLTKMSKVTLYINCIIMLTISKLPNSGNFLSVEIDHCRNASFDPGVTHK